MNVRKPAAAVGVGLVTLLVTGWPVAAVWFAIATVTVPRMLRPHAAEAMIARLDGLAEWTRRLADLLASGAGGVEQAIVTSARTCPPAISAEVTSLVARSRVHGLERALFGFADDLDDAMADRVAASLVLRIRAGGRGLTDVLDGLAASLAEDVAVRQRVEADRARSRSNVRTIIIVTAVVLAGLLLFARDFLAPYGTATGQLVLAVIGAMFATALWWMARLTRPRKEPRFLTPDRPPAHRARLWKGTR